ncbi:hypothetical protein [Seonamhaeicola aphaedonensis]|uniref:Uncharacterized protein n=1 Tax=Seonamhaeicola aphaedonensis TaxID=1461338 RepID=A0A3D9HL01_9FLAO|nr:hypothetical protein [Seonamhaeicola aphaedonensis]RED49981.1 hypothetical protein DFQ02_1011 [Seonamhaeicola aphaedonensis]
MIKTSILIFSLLVINSLVAQTIGLKIYNKQNDQEVLIKENKRIRIKTFDGLKLTGRFKIIDDETISIKKKEIKLSQIEKIKKHPLVMSILINGSLYYLAAGFIIGGVELAILAFSSGDASAILLTPVVVLIMAPAPFLIKGAIKSPNILKSYKSSEQWQYEVIE